MPENNSNKMTKEEVEEFLRVHPDHKVHLLSDLGKTKMFYKMTREDHAAEAEAIRIMDKMNKAAEKNDKSLRAAQFDSGVIHRELMGIKAPKKSAHPGWG